MVIFCLSQFDYMQFQNQRNYLLHHFQDYRIIQPQVVFIHGLPTSISQPSIIKRMLSPLGNTRRINITYLNKDFYSAFVQFQQQISAALIIVMLNEQPLFNRVLRVFFGSTKFCPHFLKGHHCRLAQCNYAHYYSAHLTHLRDNAKDIDHNYIAHLHITQYYPQAIVQIQRILSLPLELGSILEAGKQRLKYYLFEAEDHLQEDETQINQDLGNQLNEDWNSLQKQILQETQEKKGNIQKQMQETYKRSRVQEFLEAADRFLSRLIFQSSQFAY